MKNSVKRIFFVLTVILSTLFLTSCVNNLSLSNPDIEKLTQKAQQFMQKGDFKGAIGRLESINDLNPDLPENNYNLGIAYYKTDQYEKAVKSLQKAIELDKNLKDAYYTLAVVYEEIALQKTENLKEINNDEEKVDLFVKISQNYKKARDNYLLYLNFVGITEEREQLINKLKEFNTKIEEIAQKLPEPEQEEIEKN